MGVADDRMSDVVPVGTHDNKIGARLFCFHDRASYELREKGSE
jgi:hypothetical protein